MKNSAVGADGNPPVPSVKLQVLTTCKGFEGIPVGTIIESPTPEQLEAAAQVKSCLHFIESAPPELPTDR